MQGTGVVGRAREGHGWVRKAKEGIVRNGKEIQCWVGLARKRQQGVDQAMQGRERRHASMVGDMGT